MTPVYSQRKMRKRGSQPVEANATPGMPGYIQVPGIEVLEKSNANAEQWDSAYQQLFDRN